MSLHVCDDFAVLLLIMQLGRVYWNQSVAAGCRFINSILELLTFSGWANAKVVGS